MQHDTQRALGSAGIESHINNIRKIPDKILCVNSSRNNFMVNNQQTANQSSNIVLLCIIVTIALEWILCQYQAFQDPLRRPCRQVIQYERWHHIVKPYLQLSIGVQLEPKPMQCMRLFIIKCGLFWACDCSNPTRKKTTWSLQHSRKYKTKIYTIITCIVTGNPAIRRHWLSEESKLINISFFNHVTENNSKFPLITTKYGSLTWPLRFVWLAKHCCTCHLKQCH